jgi:hypothetical protein
LARRQKGKRGEEGTVASRRRRVDDQQMHDEARADGRVEAGSRPSSPEQLEPDPLLASSPLAPPGCLISSEYAFTRRMKEAIRRVAAAPASASAFRIREHSGCSVNYEVLYTRTSTCPDAHSKLRRTFPNGAF